LIKKINKLFKGFKDIKKNQDKKLNKKLIEEISYYEEKIEPYITQVDFASNNILKELNIDSLIKTTTINEKTISIANGILENKLFLMNSLDVISFDDKINWNYFVKSISI